eukprot:6527273-Prymnesium_polylepis.1
MGPLTVTWVHLLLHGKDDMARPIHLGSHSLSVNSPRGSLHILAGSTSHLRGFRIFPVGCPTPIPSIQISSSSPFSLWYTGIWSRPSRSRLSGATPVFRLRACRTNFLQSYLVKSFPVVKSTIFAK